MTGKWADQGHVDLFVLLIADRKKMEIQKNGKRADH